MLAGTHPLDCMTFFYSGCFLSPQSLDSSSLPEFLIKQEPTLLSRVLASLPFYTQRTGHFFSSFLMCFTIMGLRDFSLILLLLLSLCSPRSFTFRSLKKTSGSHMLKVLRSHCPTWHNSWALSPGGGCREFTVVSSVLAGMPFSAPSLLGPTTGFSLASCILGFTRRV